MSDCQVSRDTTNHLHCTWDDEQTCSRTSSALGKHHSFVEAERKWLSRANDDEWQRYSYLDGKKPDDYWSDGHGKSLSHDSVFCAEDEQQGNPSRKFRQSDEHQFTHLQTGQTFHANMHVSIDRHDPQRLSDRDVTCQGSNENWPCPFASALRRQNSCASKSNTIGGLPQTKRRQMHDSGEILRKFFPIIRDRLPPAGLNLLLDHIRKYLNMRITPEAFAEQVNQLVQQYQIELYDDEGELASIPRPIKPVCANDLGTYPLWCAYTKDVWQELSQTHAPDCNSAGQPASSPTLNITAASCFQRATAAAADAPSTPRAFPSLCSEDFPGTSCNSLAQPMDRRGLELAAHLRETVLCRMLTARARAASARAQAAAGTASPTGLGPVTVRLVADARSTGDGQAPQHQDARCKAIIAFRQLRSQETAAPAYKPQGRDPMRVAGVCEGFGGCSMAEVLLFAMYVDEHGPGGVHAGQAHVRYVDSTPLYADEEAEERQAILTAIVLGYIEYTARSGQCSIRDVHLCVAPPTDGMAVFFAPHRAEVQLRAAAYLARWFRQIANLALTSGYLTGYEAGPGSFEVEDYEHSSQMPDFPLEGATGEPGESDDEASGCQDQRWNRSWPRSTRSSTAVFFALHLAPTPAALIPATANTAFGNGEESHAWCGSLGRRQNVGRGSESWESHVAGTRAALWAFFVKERLSFVDLPDAIRSSHALLIALLTEQQLLIDAQSSSADANTLMPGRHSKGTHGNPAAPFEMAVRPVPPGQDSFEPTPTWFSGTTSFPPSHRPQEP